MLIQEPISPFITIENHSNRGFPTPPASALALATKPVKRNNLKKTSVRKNLTPKIMRGRDSMGYIKKKEYNPTALKNLDISAVDVLIVDYPKAKAIVAKVI